MPPQTYGANALAAGTPRGNVLATWAPAKILQFPLPAMLSRDKLEALQVRFWSERSSFDSHWKELGDYLRPRRTRFWTGDRNKGDKGAGMTAGA